MDAWVPSWFQESQVGEGTGRAGNLGACILSKLQESQVGERRMGEGKWGGLVRAWFPSWFLHSQKASGGFPSALGLCWAGAPSPLSGQRLGRGHFPAAIPDGQAGP